MALKTSTGLRNAMLVDGSLAAAFDLGRIEIYAGTVPGTADEAIPGGATLLCTITNNSTATGTTMDTVAYAGSVSKAPAEVWSGVNVATGTATFYRHVGATDDGTLSTTQPRLQGTVGTVGAELNLSAINLTNGATQTIDYYSVALPTL